MTTRKRATTSVPDQAPSQRPGPSKNTATSPPPQSAVPPSSAAPVTLDQFNTLVQQVQALTQRVQGFCQARLSTAPGPAGLQWAPAGMAALEPSPAPLHHQVKAAAPPLRPNDDPEKAHSALPAAGDKGLLRPRRAHPASSASPRDGSTQQCRSPVPVHQVTPAAVLERQIQEMRRELDTVKRTSLPGPRAVQGPPFTEGIMKEVVPVQIKLPAIEPYNGTADPDDHLSSFKSIMLFHGASDAALCRAFPSTLRGPARVWFSALTPGSIGSFDELGRAFTSQFVSSRRYRRRSDSLSEIKQHEGESLKSFLGRFNTALLEVDHLNHEVAMSALAGGVRKDGDFYLALEVNYPQNLSDMMALADKYARVEESRRSAWVESSGGKERGHSDERRTARPLSLHHQGAPSPRQRSRSPAQRFDQFTPLTVPRARILTEMEHLLPRPEPLRGDPARRDATKYCWYHRGYGHDTEGCWQLKREIERLIRQGKLEHYIGPPEA